MLPNCADIAKFSQSSALHQNMRSHAYTHTHQQLCILFWKGGVNSVLVTHSQYMMVISVWCWSK